MRDRDSDKSVETSAGAFARLSRTAHERKFLNVLELHFGDSIDGRSPTIRPVALSSWNDQRQYEKVNIGGSDPIGLRRDN